MLQGIGPRNGLMWRRMGRIVSRARGKGREREPMEGLGGIKIRLVVVELGVESMSWLRRAWKMGLGLGIMFN